MKSNVGSNSVHHAKRRTVRRAALLLAGLILGVSLFLNGTSAQDANKPFSKDDLIGLLEGGVVPQADIAEAARSHGLNFPWTSEVESDLRAAGAEDKLINVLKQLAPKPKQTPETSTTTTTTPTSSSAAPILFIEATPGGAQVYIDGEPKATTSPAGRVRFSSLAPGAHTVRLSLAGYRDYEQQVDLKAGQTATVYATLQAAQTASTSTTTPTTTRSGGLSGNQTTPPVSGTQTTTANTNVQRFLVAHDHGLPAGQNACVGWMVVGNGRVQYQGLRAISMGQAGGPTHSLDISADEIKEVKKNGVYLAMANAFHIKLKKGANNNFYVINAQGQYQPSEPLISAISGLTNH